VRQHYTLHRRLPKWKKLDSSNKYDYTNRNDYNKSEKKKKFQKIMSRACVALSDFDFSSDDSSSLEEDKKVKCK
jgi:hypothetical protein